jgi:predicted dienelactone hydrolase
MVKRGKVAVTICSTAFMTLGHAQASALGKKDLPIVVMPHPFGLRKREDVRDIAEKCADDIAQLMSKAGAK